jgi:hypothetical protein
MLQEAITNKRVRQKAEGSPKDLPIAGRFKLDQLKTQFNKLNKQIRDKKIVSARTLSQLNQCTSGKLWRITVLRNLFLGGAQSFRPLNLLPYLWLQAYMSATQQFQNQDEKYLSNRCTFVNLKLCGCHSAVFRTRTISRMRNRSLFNLC